MFHSDLFFATKVDDEKAFARCTWLDAYGIVKNSDNSSGELLVFPSPSQDFVTITGKVGSIVTVKNLLGETIKMITLESENYTLLIENLDCGLYLLSDNLGNGAKLTISR